MLRMKNSFNLANGIILLVALCEFVGGNECTQKTAVGLPDVNMCETGTHVITGAYLSASSDQMGGGTRCTCTLVALSPQSNGSWCALNQPPRISSCSAFVTLQGSSRAQYTCQSSAVNTHVTMNASDIIIEVFRNGSADFGFCVIMTNSNYNQTNSTSLTCQSDTPSQTSSFSSPSTQSSASSSSSTQASISSSSSKETLTVVPGSTTEKSSTPISATTFDGSTKETGQGFPIGAVVGGVLGAVALIGLTVVASVYISCRYLAQRSSPPETGADNSAYTSLSDVTRVNLRADPNYAVIQTERSFSQPNGSDAAATTGVYETV